MAKKESKPDNANVNTLADFGQLLIELQVLTERFTEITACMTAHGVKSLTHRGKKMANAALANLKMFARNAEGEYEQLAGRRVTDDYRTHQGSSTTQNTSTRLGAA